MKKTQSSFAIILAMIFFTLSCQQQEEVIDKDVTVTEVQAIFDLMKNDNPNGRQEGLGIDWNGAVYKDISIGDALVFPITNPVDRYVTLKEDG